MTSPKQLDYADVPRLTQRKPQVLCNRTETAARLVILMQMFDNGIEATEATRVEDEGEDGVVEVVEVVKAVQFMMALALETLGTPDSHLHEEEVHHDEVPLPGVKPIPMSPVAMLNAGLMLEADPALDPSPVLHLGLGLGLPLRLLAEGVI
jgi:hypothetical protein